MFRLYRRSPTGGSKERPISQSGLEGAVNLLVTPPPGLEPFVLDLGQRFGECVDEGRRNRVVVFPSHPEVEEQIEVEVEAPALDLPRQRSFREDHRRHARGRAEPLLRARVAGVELPCGKLNWHGPERGHRINDRQRVGPARQSGDLGHGIDHARGRFAVDHSKVVRGGAGAFRRPRLG